MSPLTFSPSPVQLSYLTAHLPGLARASGEEATVTGIALDSRAVKAGDVFVALSGGTTDGHRFIPDALGRGASAVIGTQEFAGLPVPYVQVQNSREALAYLSAAFYGFPARKLVVIGVTGTDGKTTTCNLLYSILRTAGLAVGMISTVNAVIGDETLDTGFHVTTPEAPDVQRYLAMMVAAGLTHVILEATSHGLDQHRVTACDFDMAVVTNITHEHLDYHGSYEAYRAAKGRLFAGLAQAPPKEISPVRGAVLNRDDSSFSYLESITQAATITYGLEGGADVWAEQIRTSADGLAFEVVGTGAHQEPFRFPVSTHLVGLYNVSNCLAAVALARGLLGLPDRAVQIGIAALPGVPGRMEAIDLGQDFSAIVDFAHTPNALRRSLEAARQIAAPQSGRVIAIFGSAGLRDRQKRRMMAETSASLADLTILTAEDPRTESLDAILAEMAEGARSKGGVEGETFWRVRDRGEALRLALSFARTGDVVISCGKGHEQSMCFGVTEYPWDDRTAMRAALAEQLQVAGPAMPYLPTQGSQ